MSDETEESLLKKFDELVRQSRENIKGDCPSKDDVLIVFASEYLAVQRKRIAELYTKVDIAESRVAKLTKGKSLGVVEE